jgi:DNA-binding Lrp family transcriptional regulator
LLEKVFATQSFPSQNRILAVLSDGKAKSTREIAKLTGLSRGATENALRRLWERKMILRTKAPIFEDEKIFKGRAGIKRNTRPYHMYIFQPNKKITDLADNLEFVQYDKKYLDARGGGAKSKATKVLEFLEKNQDKAWFSTEIVSNLQREYVKNRDIMANIRRFERKGLVYVRGYKLDEGQTPFKEGYLITWIDQTKSREQAILEAVERTNVALVDRNSMNPTLERIHRIADVIVEHSKLKDLVSFNYIQDKLKCGDYEAQHALKRALQLYPKLNKIKLFNAYSYYYHSSISDEDLKAAISMKENYIRLTQGKVNRIGHNWEAASEWFVDKFTTGAHFRTQNHRTEKMDSRRITLHLIKGVGGRRNAAEVDRIWEVTPGVFAPSINYVLSCKWGLVRKQAIDDFFEVLRWTKEFGVDTPDGRQIKQGTTGVFAGQAFDPNESVKLKNEDKISLALYAARMNIQLLRAADFNVKLTERGCNKTVTVQRICRAARNENQVRELLSSVWENPVESEDILNKAIKGNEDVYGFEKILESGRPKRETNSD